MLCVWRRRRRPRRHGPAPGFTVCARRPPCASALPPPPGGRFVTHAAPAALPPRWPPVVLLPMHGLRRAGRRARLSCGPRANPICFWFRRPTRTMSADACRARGNERFARGDFAEAAAEYSKALVSSPGGKGRVGGREKGAAPLASPRRTCRRGAHHRTCFLGGRGGRALPGCLARVHCPSLDSGLSSCSLARRR